MIFSRLSVVVLLLTVAFVAGCGKQESSVDKMVDSTKDALDIREHEELKDAGEDVQDAVNDAADDIKDATN